MDAKTKVTKYLANLSCAEDCENLSSTLPHITTAGLQSLRGPGQMAHDPLQFVSTSSGVSLAENARKLISITEQQRRDRAKLSQFDENESWQEDLDTWRRKRKTKVSKQYNDNDVVSPSKDYWSTTKDYHSLPNYGRSHKTTKKEILTITSPSSHQEDQNDSGIENRTTDSHSPSTSLDFSPRSDSKLTSDRSISSKITTTYQTNESSAPPDYAPPPPPPTPPSLPPSLPQPSDSALDQVFIPLNSVSLTNSSYTRKSDNNDEYTLPSPHLQRSRKNQANISKHFEDIEADSANIDLTVELNREQRGQVTAIRYPTTKKIETIPSPIVCDDKGGATLISRISRHDQPPPPSSSLRNLINSQSTTPQLRNKGMPPTTVYRTVDIPFDESPATYQPRKDESITVVKVMMGTYPVHKGLGFSISIERGRPIIDSVIVDTPADRAGLLIGDRVIAINGEYLNNRNLPEINRMIHEAARIGEADVYIEKREAQLKNNVQLKSISSLENFDKARSVFIEKTTADSSLTDFKRKQYNRASRTDQPFPRDFSSLPRSTSTGSILESKRAVTQRSPTRQNFERTSNVRTEYRTLLSSKDASPQDYRVTSIHEKIGPGRLTDFVPEIERDTIGTINEERKEFRRASDEEPRLIRNYDLPPTAPSTKTTSTKMTSSPLISPSPRRYEDITINATPKKSTLPRNSHMETHSKHDEINCVTENSSAHLHKIHRQSYSTSTETLRRAPEINDSYTNKTTSERWCSATSPHLRHYNSHELRNNATEQNYVSGYPGSNFFVNEEYGYDEMYCKRNYNNEVGSPRDSYDAIIIPIKRLTTKDYQPMPVLRANYNGRSKSSDMILEKEYSYRRDDGRISNATHRFYDRNGKYVNRNTRQGCDLDITRDYNYARVPQIPSRRCKSVERRYEERLEYEELEKRMWITDKRQDPHEWRDVITQQRQAAPGRPAEAQKMHDANSYLGELPAIINRKFEESCKLEKEQRQTSEHGYCDTMEDRLRDVRNHEKSSNYGRIGKSYMPEYRSRLYDSSRYENHREIRNNRGTVTADPSLTSEYRLREQNPPSTDYVKRDTNVKFRDGMRHDTFTNNDQVVAVSGKHRCAHCADELGRGAAMIIESLNLFYHLTCFKCYVCKATLGSGATGADVRVRDGRLHCQSCYSNDRVQLSKV